VSTLVEATNGNCTETWLVRATGGAPAYDKKLDHYFGQNQLAKSLHPKAYEHSPGFLRFVAESGLPLRAHEQFKKADLEARQGLYRALAEQAWDPARLAVATGTAGTEAAD
jgi:hypothetical protein